MKRLLVREGLWLTILLVFILGCDGDKATHKTDIDDVLKAISEPRFPDFEVNLLSYGAQGDSVTNCKPSFDSALADLAKHGGGRLIVPAGTYTVNGPIHLVSHVNLHLHKGAVVRFGSNTADYLPVVKTSWEGTLLYNYSPFIYAYQCQNVAITGLGVIDGESSGSWSNWHALQEDDQMLSRDMNHRSIPVDKRIFGEGHFLRPHLVQFYECRNILVEGITLEDSPFWCIHLLKCKNATLRQLKYDAQNKNNDGIDPEYSQDILIEDIDFNNADDNVAIKAGRDHEGRATNIPSQNIVVRNCRFKGLHAVVIGSEMSSGVQNVFVRNCTFGGYIKRGIYLKSNPDRGGFIRNVYVRNVSFGKVEDCIYITSFYHNEGKGNITDIGHVYFNNVTCQRATSGGLVIQGFPQKKVSDIFFDNIRIDTVANALSLTDTERITMGNVVMGSVAGAPSAVR